MQAIQQAKKGKQDKTEIKTHLWEDIYFSVLKQTFVCHKSCY